MASSAPRASDGGLPEPPVGFCADCGVSESDDELIDFPRHGENVLLCAECYVEAFARFRQELEDAGRAWDR